MNNQQNQPQQRPATPEELIANVANMKLAVGEIRDALGLKINEVFGFTKVLTDSYISNQKQIAELTEKVKTLEAKVLELTPSVEVTNTEK